MNKKKWIIIAIVSVFVIALISFSIVKFIDVSKKNKKKAETTPNNIQTQTSSQIPTAQKIVITENLKMRKEPNLNADVVATLNIGDKVDVIKTGDSRVKLGGSENYWYNVSFRGSTGWIFGDDIAGKDDIDSLVKKKYSKYLDSLPKDDLDSSLKGLKMYGTYANFTTSKEINDEMFRKYQEFQSSITLSKTEEELVAEYGRYDENYIQNNASKEFFTLRNKLTQNGFRIMSSESGGYITIDDRFMFLSIGNTLSDGLREYLQIMVGEMLPYPVFDDLGLLITWNELSDRIIKREKFVEKYPNIIESKDEVKIIGSLMETYVGMDKYLQNTPVFIDDKLSDDVKASYERFISNYSSSKYYPIIKGYYDVLKKYDFKENEEAKAYLKSKGITEE